MQNGTYDEYFGQGTNQFPENNPPYDIQSVIISPTNRALERLAQKHLLRYPTPSFAIPALRQQATVRCDYAVFNTKRCNPAENPNNICLYDIKSDPCELNNLTPYYPNVARYLFKTLVLHKQTLVPQTTRNTENRLADPGLFNGTWSPWYDLSGIPYFTLNNLGRNEINGVSARITNKEPNETIL